MKQRKIARANKNKLPVGLPCRKMTFIPVLIRTETRAERGRSRRVQLERVDHHLCVRAAVPCRALHLDACQAHVLSQVVLVELGLGRGQAQVEAVLDLLHVLLQEHHVVHVLFTGHVDPQVARHVGLVVAHLETQRASR